MSQGHKVGRPAGKKSTIIILPRYELPQQQLKAAVDKGKFEGPPNLKSCERRKDPGTTALLLHTHPLRRHAQHML